MFLSLSLSFRVYVCIEAVRHTEVGATKTTALYEIFVKYASGIQAVSVNGQQITNTMGHNETDYYSVSAVGVYYGISIMVWSMEDGTAAPHVFVSKGNRHPSRNDTECASESALNRYHSHCTMKYSGSTGGRSRAIHFDTDQFGGTFYIAVTSGDNVAEGEKMEYRFVCSSRVSELELGVAVTDIAVQSAWKYFTFTPFSKQYEVL